MSLAIVLADHKRGIWFITASIAAWVRPGLDEMGRVLGACWRPKLSGRLYQSLFSRGNYFPIILNMRRRHAKVPRLKRGGIRRSANLASIAITLADALGITPSLVPPAILMLPKCWKTVASA
ncbi:hypothetical protein KCP73_00990 [Salmonella enterica subsp. enterica]|nr:hypothetical protein KCP73_00990 [Salmonella enterica subsp. enterica]